MDDNRYDLKFYADKNGRSPVKSYYEELLRGHSKGRTRERRFYDYLRLLLQRGTAIGEHYVKPIQNAAGLWELRPVNDRVFFIAFEGRKIILLHAFEKKTQKTPAREIDRALREIDEIRNGGNLID